MEAAAVGSNEVCVQLLAAGADALLKDNLGRTAGEIANQNGHRGCAVTLEEAVR
jgi:ankyrin repeat protein